MNVKKIMIGGAIAFTVGCSSAGKKNPEKSSAATPQPAQAAKVDAAVKAAPAVATATAATATKPATQTTSAAPAAQADSSDHWVTCSLAKDTRKVEIEALQPNGCKLWYTKSGDRNEIASSVSGKNHCEEVSDRIQKNLESSGFSCASGKTEERSTASAAATPASAPKPSTAAATGTQPKAETKN